MILYPLLLGGERDPCEIRETLERKGDVFELPAIKSITLPEKGETAIELRELKRGQSRPVWAATHERGL